MDRDTTDQSVIQMNFIDYVISPLYEQFVVLLPALKSVVKQLSINRSNWSNKDVVKKANNESIGGLDIIQSTPNARGNRRNVTQVTGGKTMRPVASLQKMNPGAIAEEKDTSSDGGENNEASAEKNGDKDADFSALDEIADATTLHDETKISKIDVKKVYAQLRLPDRRELSRNVQGVALIEEINASVQI